MAEFVTLWSDHYWNERLYIQIIDLLNPQIKKIQVKKKKSLQHCVPRNTVGNFKKKLSLFAIKLNRLIFNPKKLLSAILVRLMDVTKVLYFNNEHFIITTSLPVNHEFRLNLHLRQVPKIWASQTLNLFEQKPCFRNWIPLSDTPDDISITYKKFEEIFVQILAAHMPSAYLEGFASILHDLEKKPWPKSPKSIFTTNSFYWDDFFKIWTASKVIAGSSLVIGQHGGSYGVSLWNSSETHEVDISDIYLTWGWQAVNQKKIIPIGNLKNNWDKFEPKYVAL